MNSALYKARVMHHRFEPKRHRFHYNVFMFWLDLDELPELSRRIGLISLGRFNVFSWYDKDHVQLPAGRPDRSKGTREQLDTFLRSCGQEQRPASVRLLTNLRTWGYQFNPVSFYFCYDEKQQPYCAVAEVGNTFGEMKLYYLGETRFDGKAFRLRVPKMFYVSPFIDHDAEFDFVLHPPGEKLDLRIDDYKDDKRIFISTLTGRRRELTNARLLGYALRFPAITLKVIFLIHWNAFRLWLKKIPFRRKADQPELQRDVLRRYEDQSG